MTTLTLQELKRIFVQAGFEVYRTREHEVHLAERPRENLIMDAGVVITKDAPHEITFVVRAQKADFPGETPDRLFDRARALAILATARGYAESDACERTLVDPGDRTKVLDIWYEVFFRKSVADLPEAIDEARFALTLEKTAHDDEELGYLPSRHAEFFPESKSEERCLRVARSVDHCGVRGAVSSRGRRKRGLRKE